MQVRLKTQLVLQVNLLMAAHFLHDGMRSMKFTKVMPGAMSQPRRCYGNLDYRHTAA